MLRAHYRHVILGAGVSGLSTALVLAQKLGGDVLVLEREAAVGGQCRTLVRAGGAYDTGSHRIHERADPVALELIRTLCGERVTYNARGGQLRIHGRYIDYPITSFRMLTGLGLLESTACAASLGWARFRDRLGLMPDESSNYESYLVRRAGKRGYRLFYEPYARKVWGCEPREISLTAVKKRISMTSPAQILVDMFRHLLGRAPRQHYYYVDGGIGGIPAGLAGRVREAGGEIQLNVDAITLQDTQDGGRFLVQAKTGSGEFCVSCDTLVSTIPIRELMAKLGVENRLTCEARQLTWRGLRFVAIHIGGEPRLAGETFYFPELQFAFGRVSVPKRYSHRMLDDGDAVTSILCEVPCTDGETPAAQTDESLIELCFRDLVRAGFVDGGAKRLRERDFAWTIGGTYPVYYTGWETAFEEALAILGRQFPRLYVSGKQGLYLHCNLDHAMSIGLDLGAHLLAQGSAEAWYQRVPAFHAMRIRD